MRVFSLRFTNSPIHSVLFYKKRLYKKQYSNFEQFKKKSEEIGGFFWKFKERQNKFKYVFTEINHVVS